MGPRKALKITQALQYFELLLVKFVEIRDGSKNYANILQVARIMLGDFQLVKDVVGNDVLEQPFLQANR